MRITGLVAAATLSACHPVGIVGDGTGPHNSSVCDQEDHTCAPGHGHGSVWVAYGAIAAVLLAPAVLRLLYPHGSYHER
jgi:hypothetical protein